MVILSDQGFNVRAPKRTPMRSVAEALIVLIKINAAEVFVRRFGDFCRHLSRQTLGLEAANDPNNKKTRLRRQPFRARVVNIFIKY